MLKLCIGLLLSLQTAQGFSNPLKYFSWFADEIEEISPAKEYACDPQAIIDIETFGSVEFQTWKHPRIMIHPRKTGSPEAVKTVGITVKNDHKTVSIQTTSNPNYPTKIHCVIMIPEQATLKVHAMGDIKVLNSMAPAYLESLNGNIKVLHSQSTVHACAPKGKVTIKQRALPANSSIVMNSYYNGKLALSRNHNANIHAKTSYGTISIDLFVSLEPLITKINQRTWQRLMKDIKVVLGDGGATIVIETSKGAIEIIEY